MITIKIKAELSIEYLKGAEDIGAVKYGTILLAQVGDKEYVKEINSSNLNYVFLRSQEEQLEFYVNSDDGEKVRFIPLYMIEDEVYTVYINLSKKLEEKRLSEKVNDGSEAYDN